MRNSDGFTLVEFLVAMVISLIVMSSIYSVYRSQQKSYVAQEQITVMQQNLRAGMTMITRDIRTAGYDPTRSLGTGIISANSDQLQFTRVVESGSTEVETITSEILSDISPLQYNVYREGLITISNSTP